MRIIENCASIQRDSSSCLFMTKCKTFNNCKLAGNASLLHFSFEVWVQFTNMHFLTRNILMMSFSYFWEFVDSNNEIVRGMQDFLSSRLLFKVSCSTSTSIGSPINRWWHAKTDSLFMIIHDKFVLLLRSLLTAIIKLSEVCKFSFMISLLLLRSLFRATIKLSGDMQVFVHDKFVLLLRSLLAAKIKLSGIATSFRSW
jgi:hypothetical protein